MGFDRINRRTHLYLGLFLLAWLAMYGVTAIPLAHHGWFDAWYDDGAAEWTERFARECDLEVPAGSDPRATAARILADAGMGGRAFWASWRGEEDLVIYTGTFWARSELHWFPAQRRLVARDARFRWDHALSGLHATGGFVQERFWSDAWAVVVDLVMVAILLWAATGLYMWWGLRESRWPGALALGAGLVLVLVLAIVV